jgi:hypothetical protein
MVLDYKKATKKQLLQIVLEEQCSIIYKFEAANEFKKRDRKGLNKAIKQAKMVRKRDC